MSVDNELQDAYERARAAGVLDKDPELRDVIQRAVKAGVLKDASGGSTPNVRVPGVTFRTPSPSMGDVRAYEGRQEAAEKQWVKTRDSMKPASTPEAIRWADPNNPRFANKSVAKDFRDMVVAEADSALMVPTAGFQRMIGKPKQAAKTVKQGLKAAGNSLSGRAVSGLIGGSIKQDEGGAASRAFAQGVAPGAGGLTGFAAGARVGAKVPGPAPIKAAAGMIAGLGGAYVGGAAVAKAQDAGLSLLLGNEGFDELQRQRALDQQQNPIPASLGQAATALVFGKATADDVRAIPEVLRAIRSGMPLHQALATPAGHALSETLRERMMEAGVEVVAASGENLITGKPMDWRDTGVQALSGALLPGENRFGQPFVNAGNRLAGGFRRGSASPLPAPEAPFDPMAYAASLAPQILQPATAQVQPTAPQIQAPQGLLAMAGGLQPKQRSVSAPQPTSRTVPTSLPAPSYQQPATSSLMQPIVPSGTLDASKGNLNVETGNNKPASSSSSVPVRNGIEIPNAADRGVASGTGTVPQTSGDRSPQSRTPSVESTAPGGISGDQSTEPGVTPNIELVAPESVGVMPGIQYKRGINKKGVTDLLEGESEYKTELGDTLTAWRAPDGQLYAIDGHHRRELAERAKKFTTANPDGSRRPAPRQIQVRILDSKDGWTQERARIFGVTRNLSENKGLAIDAADAYAAVMSSDEARQTIPKIKTPLIRDTRGLVLLDEAGRALVRNRQVEPSVAAAVGEVLRGDKERQRIALEQAIHTDGVRNYDDGAALAAVVRDEQIVKKSDAQESMFGDDESAGGTTYQSTAGEQAAIRSVVKRRLQQEQSNLLAVDRTEARDGEVFDTQGRRQEAGAVKDAKSKADVLFEFDPDVKGALRQAAADVANGRISRDEGAKRVRDVVLKQGKSTLAEIVARGNAAAAPAAPEPQGGGLFGDSNPEGMADMFDSTPPPKKTEPVAKAAPTPQAKPFDAANDSMGLTPEQWAQLPDADAANALRIRARQDKDYPKFYNALDPARRAKVMETYKQQDRISANKRKAEKAANTRGNNQRQADAEANERKEMEKTREGKRLLDALKTTEGQTAMLNAGVFPPQENLDKASKERDWARQYWDASRRKVEDIPQLESENTPRFKGDSPTAMMAARPLRWTPWYVSHVDEAHRPIIGAVIRDNVINTDERELILFGTAPGTTPEDVQGSLRLVVPISDGEPARRARQIVWAIGNARAESVRFDDLQRYINDGTLWSSKPISEMTPEEYLASPQARYRAIMSGQTPRVQDTLHPLDFVANLKKLHDRASGSHVYYDSFKQAEEQARERNLTEHSLAVSNAKALVAKNAAGKQPWEMTLEEYIQTQRPPVPNNASTYAKSIAHRDDTPEGRKQAEQVLAQAKSLRKADIKMAIREGKNVPQAMRDEVEGAIVPSGKELLNIPIPGEKAIVVHDTVNGNGEQIFVVTTLDLSGKRLPLGEVIFTKRDRAITFATEAAADANRKNSDTSSKSSEPIASEPANTVAQDIEADEPIGTQSLTDQALDPAVSDEALIPGIKKALAHFVQEDGRININALAGPRMHESRRVLMQLLLRRKVLKSEAGTGATLKALANIAGVKGDLYMDHANKEFAKWYKAAPAPAWKATAPAPSTNSEPVAGGLFEDPADSAITPELQNKRAEVLDIIARDTRNKSGTPVEKFEVEGSNGKWYSPNGVPVGVKTTGKRRSVGWSSQTRDGVRVGNVYPTEKAWEEAREKRVASEAKSMAAAMQTPEDIERQWNYWVKERSEKKARIDAAMAGDAGNKKPIAAPPAPPADVVFDLVDSQLGSIDLKAALQKSDSIDGRMDILDQATGDVAKIASQDMLNRADGRAESLGWQIPSDQHREHFIGLVESNLFGSANKYAEAIDTIRQQRSIYITKAPTAFEKGKGEPWGDWIEAHEKDVAKAAALDHYSQHKGAKTPIEPANDTSEPASSRSAPPESLVGQKVLIRHRESGHEATGTLEKASGNKYSISVDGRDPNDIDPRSFFFYPYSEKAFGYSTPDFNNLTKLAKQLNFGVDVLSESNPHVVLGNFEAAGRFGRNQANGKHGAMVIRQSEKARAAGFTEEFALRHELAHGIDLSMFDADTRPYDYEDADLAERLGVPEGSGDIEKINSEIEALQVARRKGADRSITASDRAYFAKPHERLADGIAELLDDPDAFRRQAPTAYPYFEKYLSDAEAETGADIFSLGIKAKASAKVETSSRDLANLQPGDLVEDENGQRFEISSIDNDTESVNFGDIYGRAPGTSEDVFLGNRSDDNGELSLRAVSSTPAPATPAGNETPIWQKERPRRERGQLGAISGLQASRTSGRQLDRLNDRADRAMGNVQEGLSGYDKAIIDAYEKGEITEKTPGLHRDASEAIHYHKIRVQEQSRLDQVEDLRKWSSLTLPDLTEGMSIYSGLAPDPYTVEKINTKSVTLRRADGTRFRDNGSGMSRVGHYDRLKIETALIKGEPIAQELLDKYPAVAERYSKGKELISNEPSRSTNLERNRQDATPQDAMGQESLFADRGSDNAVTGERVSPAQEAGDSPYRSGTVSEDASAAAGKRGDKPVRDAAPRDGAGSTRGDAGSDDPARSDTLGLEGLPVESVGAAAVDRAADAGDAEPDAATKQKLAELVVKQKAAESIPVKPGDIDNIRETLPVLQRPQQDDVLFAEKRFVMPKGHGVMFTNGTGTGKTFTGLGIVKRFQRQGKSNILIVAPAQEIIDAWVKAAPNLNLTITQLPDTKTAGEGIVVTTYANLQQNPSLATRNWDLVVADESHKLMSNQDGDDSLASDALKAITLHPSSAWDRTLMLNPELYQRLTQARDDRSAAKDDKRHADEAKFDAIVTELANELDAKRKVIKAEIDARQDDRPKVVFLSATPFAWEKTTHYAEGYLFSYAKADESGAYNVPSGRNKFMIENFGWKIRTGKLTKPDAAVDRALMQREFNNRLKREGALSGRALDVPFDYDRRFILAESSIGKKIDEGLRLLWDDDEFRHLRDHVDGQFGALEKRYLMEALKARDVIPIIKKHLELGRKVVIFHDYNKGGTDRSPFDVRHLLSSTETVSISKYDRFGRRMSTEKVPLARIAMRFVNEHPDLVDLPLHKLKSPINAIKEAFPDVLQINGVVPKSASRKAVELFQDDNSGRNLVIVQSDKGAAGISLHDTTGKFQRVLINLGMPSKPTTAIQIEGRVFRVGQATNAILRYMTTGTNWERGAFAEVGSRSSEAENLALGEGARALRDQFIQAYTDAEPWEPGHEGEGTGGKELDQAAMNATSAYDRAKTFYYAQMKKNSRTKAAEGQDYFATPEPIGYKMVEWLDPRIGEALLEPSAGHAAIARWFPDQNERTLVEPSQELSTKAMAAVPNARVIQGRFEDLHDTNKYDGIAMNPPFGNGGKLAIEHLEKAYGHLRSGGRIVALLPAGGGMADKRLDKWLSETTDLKIKPAGKIEALGDVYKGDVVTGRARRELSPVTGVVTSVGSYSGSVHVRDSQGREHSLIIFDNIDRVGPRVQTIPARGDLAIVARILLPEVTFARAATNVRTQIVVLESGRNPADVRTITRDLTDIDDINHLFDEMEDLSLPTRRMPSQSSSLEKSIIKTVNAPQDGPIDDSVFNAPGSSSTGRTLPSPLPLLRDKSGKPVPHKPIDQISRDFERRIGAYVRKVAQRPGKGGTFHPVINLASLPNMSNFDSRIHELAHVLDSKFGIAAQWAGSPNPSPYDAELAPFGVHGSQPPAGLTPEATQTYIRAEGVAEWVRAFIINPEEAVAAAPDFATYFNQALAPEVLNAVRSFSGDMRRYLSNDSGAAMERMRSFVHFDQQPIPWRDKVGALFGKQDASQSYRPSIATVLKQRFRSDAAAILAPVELALQSKGVDRRFGVFAEQGGLNPSQDPEIALRNVRYLNAKIEDFFKNGIKNAKGKRGIPVSEVFRPLADIDFGGEAETLRAFQDAQGRAIARRYLAEVERWDRAAQAAVSEYRDKLIMAEEMKLLRKAELINYAAKPEIRRRRDLAFAAADKRVAVREAQIRAEFKSLGKTDEQAIRNLVATAKREERRKALDAIRRAELLAFALAEKRIAVREGAVRGEFKSLGKTDEQAIRHLVASSRREERRKALNQIRQDQILAEHADGANPNVPLRLKRLGQRQDDKSAKGDELRQAVGAVRALELEAAEEALARIKIEQKSKAREKSDRAADRILGALQDIKIAKGDELRQAVASVRELELEAAEEALARLEKDEKAKARTRGNKAEDRVWEVVQNRLDRLDANAANRIDRRVDAYRARMNKALRIRSDRSLGIGAGFASDVADVKRVLAGATHQYSNDQIKAMDEFGDRLMEFSRQTLEYMVEQGRLSAEAYQAIQDSRDFYTPLEKFFAEEAVGDSPVGAQSVAGVGAGRGLNTRVNTVKSYQGKAGQLESPVVTVLKNSYASVREADRNAALRSILDVFQGDNTNGGLYQNEANADLARFAYPVPIPKMSDGSDARPGPSEVDVYRLGVKERWHVSDDELLGVSFYNALANLGAIHTPPGLLVIPRTIRDVLQWTATKTVKFALFNKIRDIEQRMLVSKTQGYNPVRDLADQLTLPKDQERELMDLFAPHAGKTDYLADPTDFYKVQRMILQNLGIQKRSIGDWAKKLEKGLETPIEILEKNTRLAEVRSAQRFAKASDLSQYEANIFALDEARKLQDFTEAGEWTRFINRNFIPFLTAHIEGKSRHVDALFNPRYNHGTGWRRQAVRMAIKGLLLGAVMSALTRLASSIYSKMHHEDTEEERREFPGYINDTYWLVKGGPDQWFSVPKPQDLGIVLSLVDRLIDWRESGNKKYFTEGLDNSIIDGLMPINPNSLTGGPSAIGMEIFTNKNFYTGDYIVSPFEEKKDLSLRKGTAKASPLARKGQEISKIDARIIDHVVGALFADYGRIGQKVTRLASGEKDSEGPVREAVALLGFSRPGPGSRARSVSDAQKRMDLAGVANGSSPMKPDRAGLMQETTPEGRDVVKDQLRARARSPKVDAVIHLTEAKRTFIESRLAAIGKQRQAQGLPWNKSIEEKVRLALNGAIGGRLHGLKGDATGAVTEKVAGKLQVRAKAAPPGLMKMTGK